MPILKQVSEAEAERWDVADDDDVIGVQKQEPLRTDEGSGAQFNQMIGRAHHEE